jgi:uncharacterized protein YutE (UPF0331/DUF86 family)
MTPLDQAGLERKLKHLQELLALLRAESSVSLAPVLEDRRQQLLVERLLHLSVEAASDLLEHVLVRDYNRCPQTYAETFLEAGATGVISLALAERLVPAAGLRNRPVHNYEAIDPRRVHSAIPVALRDLEELSAVLAARVAM